MSTNENIAAVVLAAGKGSRMESKKENKVTLLLADKPMIVHSVELLESVAIHPIVIVVGFAKKSVMNILGENVYFAEQTKRLGTAHAALKGFQKIPQETKHVLILNGDDSAFYKQETIKKLIEKHIASNASFTFLTIEQENPFGLGRIVRDIDGKLLKVVEEKDASPEERRIKEVNPGCYLFRYDFLKKYLKRVKKSKVTGEYYLVNLVELAVENNEKVETLNAGNIPWRGINTKEELKKAQIMYNHLDI